ncbi:MAG: S41 family peptidase [Bacteroidetes bacterium]|nr:S41 family peptidase [Bacteroidota bacterium]MBS1687007.1 S41 family peptidase [Bacteroidota bacterium]
MKRKVVYGLILGGLMAGGSIAAADHYFEISKNIDVLAAVYKDVNSSYVDETDPNKLMRTCIDGMLKTLDPFTNYISESQIETYRIQNSDKLVGVGIHYEMIDSLPVVTDLIKDLPADKAGIQIGDKILALDGTPTKGKSYEDVSKALRGQTGSTVNITLKAIDGSTRDVPVTRLEFQETNVPFYGMLTPQVGCINLKIFNPNAAKDVKEAFEKLKKDNPGMKGLVIDLRNNGGGLLHEAVNIVNLFVDKNKLVVTTKGRLAESNNVYRTLNEPVDTRIPIVILTNSGSASASEIVSGSMQDYDRAVILGQKTYGKGLVQITKNLSYNTMLKVTTAKYYIPSGRCIQAMIYAEHNDDGSVKHIPDSLRKEFKTADGRKVLDGGGIDPDVPMPKPVQTPLIQTLVNNHILFDYATQYREKHKTIAESASFHLTDQDYADFIAFARTKNYSYKTESDRLLDKLKEAATDEKYFDAVKVEYEDMQKKLDADKQNALTKNRQEITALLENEICGRYYYLHGKIEKSLTNDPLAMRAIALLNDPEGEYKTILARK